MSNSSHVGHDIVSLTREVKKLIGSFAPAGTGSPGTLKGRYFSVARTDVGEFTVTFEEKFVDLISVIAQLQLATGAAQRIQVGSFSQANKTLVLRVLGNGAAANEIQTLSFDLVPEAGTWTITFDGQTTASLDFDASTAEIEAALEALSNITSVTVGGTYGGGITIEWDGADAGENKPLVTVDDSALTDLTAEVQTLTFSAVPDEGTWTITFDGDTTAALQADASNATIQAALEALPSIGAGNVAVGGTYGGGITLTFQGDLKGQDVPIVTVDDANLFTASTNETQTLTFSDPPESGTWTITFDGQTTSALAYGASNAAIKAALEALSNVAVDEIAVSGTYGTAIQLAFQNGLGGQNVAEVTADDSAIGLNEIQTLTFSAVPDEGSWTITFDGETTALLNYNSSNSAIQSALEALDNIDPGDVVVTGTYGTAITLTFGGQYAGTNVAEVTTTDTLLNTSNPVTITPATTQAGATGGITITPATTQAGSGTPVTVTPAETTPGAAPAVTVTPAQTQAGGPADDIAANANNRVNFTAFFKNTER